MAVGQPQQMLLMQFGDFIQEAFGTWSVYWVGSSMGDDKINWRDVDVRVMLDDDEWEKMFGDLDPNSPYGHPKWRAMCIAFSNYGRHLTGLPIDFQIQTVKMANEKYPGGRSHCGTHNDEKYSGKR